MFRDYGSERESLPLTRNLSHLFFPSRGLEKESPPFTDRARVSPPLAATLHPTHHIQYTALPGGDVAALPVSQKVP